MNRVYSNRSSSSVDTFCLAVEFPSKFNTRSENSKPLYYLPQTNSEPILATRPPNANNMAQANNLKLLHAMDMNHCPSDYSQSDYFTEYSDNIASNGLFHKTISNRRMEQYESHDDQEKQVQVPKLQLENKILNDEDLIQSENDSTWREPGLKNQTEFKNEFDERLQNSDSVSVLTKNNEILTLSPQESAFALTTSDYVSPLPITSFSPVDKPRNLQKYKLQKVIEELLDSEENYVVSITMLLNYYLEPLVNDKTDGCGIPLIFIKELLDKLIENHTAMMHQLRFLYQQPRYRKNEESVNYTAAQFTIMIFELGIDIYIYEEYCNIYEDVLKLVRDFDYINLNNRKALNTTWVKGWENYLEATQPVSKRMDLSFMSLIQKPISRAAKYRLIVESFLKYTCSCNDSDNYNTIYQYYELIKSKLNKLNKNTRLSKDHDVGLTINTLLNFENSSIGMQLSLQFFGTCLMVGSLIVAWIEKDVEKSSTMGAFLYKSHLILSEISYRRVKKYDIKFIVPLSICSLFKDPNEKDGGLYTNFPYTTKLVFEDKFCQFEIMIINVTRKEHLVWQDHLDTLINFVNGPYTLDYSRSNTHKLLIVYPDTICPYDVSPLDASIYRRSKYFCYFKNPIFAKVMINFFNYRGNMDDNSILSFTCNLMIACPPANVRNISIIVTKTERINAEMNLMHIWSNELPLVFHIKRENMYKPAIKKSSSWSHLKMGMGSFRGLRTSNSFSEGINSLRNELQDDQAEQRVLKPERTKSEYFRAGNKNELKLLDSSDKMITTDVTDTDIRRINSKSYKFKSAVLGLFQISRSSSMKLATE